MKRKKILFGATDIGWRIADYKSFIEKNLNDKLVSESFSKHLLPQDFFATEYTYRPPAQKDSNYKFYLYCSLFFVKAIFKYDIFHFFSGETIFPRKLQSVELFLYRLFRKKLIMHFVGSDIRSPLYLEEKGKKIRSYLKGGSLVEPVSLKFQLKIINLSKKYADHILVSTPDLLKIIPQATYFPALLDEYVQNQLVKAGTLSKVRKIKILHSPSGIKTKGSKYIYETLSKVLKKYPDLIELILPKAKSYSHGLTRYEIIESMKSSDIVIDQLLIGWYGLKSIEALSFGCEVLCYIDEKLTKYLFPETPIINVNVQTLEDTLHSKIDALLKKNDKSKRALENNIWIDKYHSIDSYYSFLSKIWGV